MLSPDDLRILERLHGGLPLSDRPFAEVAAELGIGEDFLIERLRQWLSQGVLTRFGPLYQIERAGGRFVLAAIAVPETLFDAVAGIVNGFPEVAHNYRREHRLNMWFVVAADTPQRADDALRRIEQATGLPVLAFPKEREYFVELKLPLSTALAAAPAESRHAAQ